MKKTIYIQYYAILREQRGLSQETLMTDAKTPFELYNELKNSYGFTLLSDMIKIAINDEFKEEETLLQPNDRVVFIPPVAGG